MGRQIRAILASALALVQLTACALRTPAKAPANAPGTNAAVLDGKKIIFVGCSYTYYGGVVINTPNSVFSQEDRSGDQGYFYQLCRANGAEVSVTDWCFGGHDLTDLFDGSCNADRGHNGHDHLADLTDRQFDYVVFQDIQISGWRAEDYVESAKAVMAVFREANPEVRFLYTVHDGPYMNHYPAAWKDAIRLIEREGVTIVDWGTLVWDVIHTAETVPGGKLPYHKSSFIVSDGYHPNLLSGYLSALMTYCAITGETAVGQSYSFCLDDPVDPHVDAEWFRQSYYKTDDPLTAYDERETNFTEIFASAEDMCGLQRLADQYLSAQRKLDSHYTVTFQHEDGTVIRSGTYCYGDTVLPPPRPASADPSCVCVGWDREVVSCMGDATYTARFAPAAARR